MGGGTGTGGLPPDVSSESEEGTLDTLLEKLAKDKEKSVSEIDFSMFLEEKQKGIYLKLGDLYTKNQFFYNAIDAYATALSLFKGAAESLSKLIELGDLLMKREPPEVGVATKAYEKAGAKEKIAKVGDWYFGKNRLCDAVKLYKESEDKEALAKVGEEYLKRHSKLKQGEQYYSANPEIDNLKAAADIYVHIGDKKKIAEIGDLYLKQGMYDSAVEMYKKAGKKKYAEFILRNFLK